MFNAIVLPYLVVHLSSMFTLQLNNGLQTCEVLVACEGFDISLELFMSLFDICGW